MASSRTEFTKALAKLIQFADESGIDVLLDWVLRDTATQQRFFKEGKSKCDGIHNKSRHQSGLAADMYIVRDGQLADDPATYGKLHDKWDELGGRERISWDLGHFEF